MFKRFFLLSIVVLLAAWGGLSPAAAQSSLLANTPTPPPCPRLTCVYVDQQKNDANEDGSIKYPYNNPTEGAALAQSNPDGAYVIVKNSRGTWVPATYVPRANAGGQGAPLPAAVLYTLLIVLAVGLVLVGRWLMRRRPRSQD